MQNLNNEPHKVDEESVSCGCNGECNQDVDRRVFLKSAGASVALLSGASIAESVMAGPFSTIKSDEIQHFVPADKKLSRTWLAGLTQRGKARICRGKELDSIAMPIGGICAGQLYITGDGTLASWQIFNKRHFSGYGRDNYKYRKPDSPVDQGFAVVVNHNSTKQAVKLNKSGFSEITFTGEYPIATINYKSDSLPVSVKMEAFSPFIPINEADSSLPATCFEIEVTNTSEDEVSVSILSWLENVVCFHNAEYLLAERNSSVKSKRGRSEILHQITEKPQDKRTLREPIVISDFEGGTYKDWKIDGEAFGAKPSIGTFTRQQNVSGFSGEGLVNTYLDDDALRGTLTSPEFEISRDFINFLIGGGNHPEETCINLLVDGTVVRTATGRNQEKLLWFGWNVKELSGKTAQIQIVDSHSGAWGHINIDQIEQSDTDRRGPTGPLEKLEDFGTMSLATDSPVQAPEKTGQALKLLNNNDVEMAASQFSCNADVRKSLAMLSEDVTLNNGESQTFRFILSWHFPNREQGNHYATIYDNSSHVADYVLENYKDLAGETRLWHKTFYVDSTLPRWLLDRLHSTVGNLATGTCQWWADGRFWAWEGVGCCHGTCTHVWNYAHAVARLFPKLEKSAREMQDLGVALHENGLVGFRGDQNGAYAADGQAGTVLKSYREHLMSKDNRFLLKNWPEIKRVLLFSIDQDADDDGLIENSQHNTYDINFEGPNTFVGSLYLAALRAGEAMARIVGDTAFADRLNSIFVKGSMKSVERLFDGEYFKQIVDLEKHPKYQYGEGSLADQMFGQGWAKHLGLGDIYPTDHVQSALKSVWKYNWAPDIRKQNEVHKPERWFISPGEAGLFTCTWPKSKYLTQGVRYKNEVWTGIEYQVAGNMIWDGMVTEGLAICKAIHDRYHPLKRNPYNEVECGDHYARALASWGVYTALAGYEYDGPKRHIAFAPKLTPENFKTAFTTAEGWGLFTQRQSADSMRAELDMRYGRLKLSSINLNLPAGMNAVSLKLSVNDKEIKTEYEQVESEMRIQFDELAVISKGQTVFVEVS